LVTAKFLQQMGDDLCCGIQQDPSGIHVERMIHKLVGENLVPKERVLKHIVLSEVERLTYLTFYAEYNHRRFPEKKLTVV
jgi:hypothetical protein